MLYLLTFTLIVTLKGSTTLQIVSSQQQQQQPPQPRNIHSTDCGGRTGRRQPRVYPNSEQLYFNDRIPKIIAGSVSKEGQFPWQASLELLHPSMGFLGHWCGGVLIHRDWILSAAHCVHNDLFNLPLPPLWTVVLGEYDRVVESGYEQRIPVEKIILHKSYQNFLHDLVLMKLSMPADLSKKSNIRKICLPFIFDEHSQSIHEVDENQSSIDNWELLDSSPDNFLRSASIKHQNHNVTLPSMQELLTTKLRSRLRLNAKSNKRKGRYNNTSKKVKRRNDKLFKGFSDIMDSDYKFPEAKNQYIGQEYKDLPYTDCIATGWGKSNITGDLTDILLKTMVPLHNTGRCREAYGNYVKIHKGHLCAGKLDGRGGTCVGDSGGPLQCRLNKNGPWVLAGITSFGSGCAIEGFPDVYTRTSFYMKWIQETIKSE